MAKMVLNSCGEISGFGGHKNVWKYSQLTLKISTSVNHLEALLIIKFIGVALKLKFCYTPDVS